MGWSKYNGWHKSSPDSELHVFLSRDLQEGAVLQNLKKRFEREIIYVSIRATILTLLMEKKKKNLNGFFFQFIFRQISVVFLFL